VVTVVLLLVIQRHLRGVELLEDSAIQLARPVALLASQDAGAVTDVAVVLEQVGLDLFHTVDRVNPETNLSRIGERDDVSDGVIGAVGFEVDRV
jgi:hypothetical protein